MWTLKQTILVFLLLILGGVFALFYTLEYSIYFHYGLIILISICALLGFDFIWKVETYNSQETIIIERHGKVSRQWCSPDGGTRVIFPVLGDKKVATVPATRMQFTNKFESNTADNFKVITTIGVYWKIVDPVRFYQELQIGNRVRLSNTSKIFFHYINNLIGKELMTGTSSVRSDIFLIEESRIKAELEKALVERVNQCAEEVGVEIQTLAVQNFGFDKRLLEIWRGKKEKEQDWLVKINHLGVGTVREIEKRKALPKKGFFFDPSILKDPDDDDDFIDPSPGRA